MKNLAEELYDAQIAIVGGGRFCKQFIELLFNDHLMDREPCILGVADVNPQAVGMDLAREKGIYTTQDYKDFFKFENLEVILELTDDDTLWESIKRNKPSQVRLIDHYEAMVIWDALQMDMARNNALEDLRQEKDFSEKMEQMFFKYSEKLEDIATRRTKYARSIAKELVGRETTMAQIIQGSTIPTFVLNKDHVITHWNKALENLTGYSSQEMVGTKKQSFPFWEKERPTMADVILDQYEEGELWKYYGENWSKSALIEEAYEAEIFFPSLGDEGKWCFFTAAPIKSPEGSIIGAIETLWDMTEKKKAEEERERYTQELSALCSIYTALSAPWDLSDRINASLREIRQFLSSDCIGVFLQEYNGHFYLSYQYGFSDKLRQKYQMADTASFINQVAQNGELLVYKDLDQRNDQEGQLLKDEGMRSCVYIPIRAREVKSFGVILAASRSLNGFSYDKKNVLELIGNRIGATIENAILQERYIKSEKKYRSLFNNDPNPIFLLDSQTFEILDCNKRAQDQYGYSREEFLSLTFLDLGKERDDELAESLKNISPEQSILFSRKRHYRKNGLPFYVNINVSNARYGEKDILIATTTDITESVEKEAQLVQASKMTTLGTMVAGMAHEISQPLNVMQVCADYFSKMIKKGEEIDDEDLKSIAEDISSNVQRAAGIIKHMRDFARQSEVVKAKVNINDPIHDVFRIFGHQLKVHGVELELDLDENISPIYAEHNRLEQVFVNLVSNALDAINEKKEASQNAKKLTVKSFQEDAQVVVIVSDTGKGMPPEIMNKIFEPFFTTKEVGKGTGLGVSISYGIIKDFDGSIDVSSEPGKGTTFELRFPALQKAQ